MRRREKFAWTTAGLLVTSMLLGGGGFQGTNYRNGDVNGDGAIDIGDPIYLLAYLFDGGPAPVTIRGRIPETGQQECFDGIGNVVSCEDPLFPGQEPAVSNGPLGPGRFTDAHPEYVIDELTGLMWSKQWFCAATWEEALAGAASFQGGGFTDWRVPNVNELITLRGMHHGTIDPNSTTARFAPGLPADFVYVPASTSSTTSPADSGFAIGVGEFVTPIPKTASGTCGHLYRPVRGPID